MSQDGHMGNAEVPSLPTAEVPVKSLHLCVTNEFRYSSGSGIWQVTSRDHVDLMGRFEEEICEICSHRSGHSYCRAVHRCTAAAAEV